MSKRRSSWIIRFNKTFSGTDKIEPISCSVRHLVIKKSEDSNYCMFYSFLIRSNDEEKGNSKNAPA